MSENGTRDWKGMDLVLLIAFHMPPCPDSEREHAADLLHMQWLQGLPPGLQPPERPDLRVPVQ